MKPNPSPLCSFSSRILLVGWMAFSMSPIRLAAGSIDLTVDSPSDDRTFKASGAKGRGVAAEKLAGLEEKPVAAIQHYNLAKDKVALSGYDPVGYFTLNKALKGRKEVNAQHRGVTYWFASEETKTLFTESPAKYLPSYGGWCATAMAKGEKVEIDPTNYKVTNGRLFLFFKAFYGNAIKDWNKDESTQTAKADANWKQVAGE